MPIYEYKCEQGHTFEVMQRISDDPVASCQTCEAPVQRVLHPVAVHFKGKGFYNTDYGTKNRARELAKAGEGKSSSDSDSSSDSKSSDSKSSPGKSSEGKSESKSDSKSKSAKPT